MDETNIGEVDGRDARREEWRRISVIRDLVAARFVGHGPDGYRMGLEYLKEHV